MASWKREVKEEERQVEGNRMDGRRAGNGSGEDGSRRGHRCLPICHCGAAA